ncbi:Cellulose synthase-like protein G3 [Ananas comosus]|uniref:Cellulose synthase-like protein G3 n=1 Tax=Ananas comosus TaxID=4615 RepID=A0A199VIV1_ANACO|nr:Cellulose synthase-like protein G3 [Ananas comosus]
MKRGLRMREPTPRRLCNEWGKCRKVVERPEDVGVTSYLFGTIEFALNRVGIASQGFNVTNKVTEEEQSKRYNNGVFDFGIASPFFISLGVTANPSLASFIAGITRVAVIGIGLFDEIFIAANCLPIYEAMFFRRDNGKLPRNVTLTSIFLAGLLLYISAFGRVPELSGSSLLPGVESAVSFWYQSADPRRGGLGMETRAQEQKKMEEMLRQLVKESVTRQDQAIQELKERQHLDMEELASVVDVIKSHSGPDMNPYQNMRSSKAKTNLQSFQ